MLLIDFFLHHVDNGLIPVEDDRLVFVSYTTAEDHGAVQIGTHVIVLLEAKVRKLISILFFEVDGILQVVQAEDSEVTLARVLNILLH